MEIHVPEPRMAEYIVVELRTEIDKITKRQRLVSDNPRAVNTFEMVNQVHLDGLFIVGWRELHMEPYQDNVGAIRYNDRYVTRTHRENQVRVSLIGKAWENVEATSPLVPFNAPKLQSMERDLIEMGWQFDYRPEVGPVFPLEWESQLNCVLEPGLENKSPVRQPEAVRETRHPSAEIPRPVNDNNRVDALELKVDKLTDMLTQFVESNTKVANNNRTRNRQRRLTVPPAEDEGSTGD